MPLDVSQVRSRLFRNEQTKRLGESLSLSHLWIDVRVERLQVFHRHRVIHVSLLVVEPLFAKRESHDACKGAWAMVIQKDISVGHLSLCLCEFACVCVGQVDYTVWSVLPTIRAGEPC